MNTSRRDLLKMLGLASSGLMVNLALPTFGQQAQLNDTGFDANAFLHLSPEGVLSFVFPRAEMGQGALHGLTSLIAEELNVGIAHINVLQAPADAKRYGNPVMPNNMQVTGGSTSMIAHFQPLRHAAANMHAALINAAAEQLGVTITDVTLDQQQILVADQAYPWGDFTALAATHVVPDAAPLKSAAAFTTIGKPSQRIDALSKSTGTAVFGLDVELDNLHRAVVVRCPVLGGKVKSANTEMVAALQGIVGVYIISTGVAVVAEYLWDAKKAGEALQIEWSLPSPLKSIDSAELPAQFAELGAKHRGKKAHEEGDETTVFADADEAWAADYYTPYLAHATLEPPNCTVRLTDDRCDVWTGTQAPEIAAGITMSMTGLSPEQVHIHNQMLGGGFGRRLGSDYIIEAIDIAKASGLAIQLVWSREDDIRNDYYRPPSLMRMRASVGADGRLASWGCQRVGPQTTPHLLPEILQGVSGDVLPPTIGRWLGRTGGAALDLFSVDDSSVEGLFGDYEIPNQSIYQVTEDPGLRLGFWRSVGHSFTAFGKECFLDEVIQQHGEDPIEFRLRHLQNNPRLSGVVSAVAALAGWSEIRDSGRHFGVAAHTCFGTSVAEIAEISVSSSGAIKVERVWCAVDCGYAVNPDIVKMQMESGIVFGLTAALYGEINLVDGEVQESNFHDYPLLRMNESPAIEVVIVNSTDADAPLGGVGEPGTPPIAPAVANAVFAATGQRLRTLPLRLS